MGKRSRIDTGDSTSSSGGGGSSDSEMMNDEEESYNFWSRAIDRHCLGVYSFAVKKGDSIMEDYSQVVAGTDFTFVGVFDGYGGHQTSQYLCNHMFKNLISCIQEHSTLSAEVLKETFLKTEANWVGKLEKQCKGGDQGSSSSWSYCLLGIIWKASLYVANMGFSKAIMFQRAEGSTKVNIQPLACDDIQVNVNDPEAGGYRIIGETTKLSVGDLRIKYTELPLEPFIGERFVIFASQGFWRLLDMLEAAQIVFASPWKGIAALLIYKALENAAEKLGLKYEDVLNTKDTSGMKLRHADITVVVLFLNKNLDVTDIQEQMSIKIGGIGKIMAG